MSALQRETLAFRNPNKEWVVKELDALVCEWRGWQKEVEKLGEDPHNPLDPKPGRILADGEENIKKHRILQAKTLEFLENNIAGHGFITGRDGTKIDRTDLRLKIRVKHRLDDLDELRACLEYAEEAIPADPRKPVLCVTRGQNVMSIDPRAREVLDDNGIDIVRAKYQKEIAVTVDPKAQIGFGNESVSLGDVEQWLKEWATTNSNSRLATSHQQKQQNVGVTGITIFIGHGNSPVWRELRDFLEKRLHLSVNEFNSVPAAGIPTVTRLEEMLNAAAFAFLVMTAEDELRDGKLHARLNVVHEAGLFQGKLGFKKAIILLEEGCEEFSNIHGLGQIRFPRSNISTKFEEIRAVLEREGLSASL